MTRSRQVGWWVLSLALVALAACGSDNGGSSATTTTTTAP